MKKETKLTSFESALQKQFKPDANSVRKYFKAAVTKRGEWLANAVMFGVLATKAQEQLNNGFSDWLESICAEAGKSKRTGYNYIYLAKNLLRKIQNSRKGDILFDTLEIYKQQANKTTNELFESEKDTINMLSFIFSAIPEPTLNEILRESNAAALDAEKTEKKSLSKSQSKGLEGSAQPKSPQMLLWEDWTEKLEDIDTLLDESNLLNLEPEQALKIEQKLEFQLSKIREITSKIK